MNEIKITNEGGYRQASKYLIKKHGSSFAILLDALVHIHNYNIKNLVTINNQTAVKISNGYLSRNTGLGIEIIKSTIKKIEATGLVLAVKKGQGNTRHYIIFEDRINLYIKSLKPEFEHWYNKSLESSKKDKSRSDESYSLKFEESLKNFKKATATIPTKSEKSINGLGENPPTQLRKTDQPNDTKPTVVETKKETIIETTTKTTIVVVDEVFNQEDEKGAFKDLKENGGIVYKKEYEEFINNYTQKQVEELLTEFGGGFDNIKLDNYTYNEETGEDEYEDSWLPETYSKEEIMMRIYELHLSIEISKKNEKKREFETTKDPANPDISNKNWKGLEDAYKNLPHFINQGKFFTSKQDKINFSTLSEFRQDLVIKQVVAMQKDDRTASRPSIYIEEAMEGNLKAPHKPEKRLNIAL